ncbi:MAG: DUF4190 domain-containing protein [Acidimicrobiales bacterium]
MDPSPTNGFAVASLVCSIAGIIPFFFGVTCLLGIAFGFVGMSQVKHSHGAQRGRGMAMAGVIVGAALIVIIFVVLVVALNVASNDVNAGVGAGLQ